MIPKEDLILFLKPMFKNEGFSKMKSTWHKSTGDLIHVFNIQSSLYGAECYINVGVYIKALGTEDKPPEYHCHIRARMNNENSPEEIFREAKAWFETYGSTEKLKNICHENQLPLTTTLDTKKYLSGLINS